MNKLLLLLLIILLLLPVIAFGGKRYWVGDGGNWSDDDNHWATSSSGTPADTWYAGDNSTDGGTNTGWLFETPGWSNGIFMGVTDYSTILGKDKGDIEKVMGK